MVSYFPLSEIVFYSLELEVKQENLQDLLEEKICLILGLDRECEYFLSYCYVNQKYHCILINKDKLKNFNQKSSFLTSPIFVLQALYAKEGLCGFILQDLKDLAFVWIENAKIIFYELLKQEEICDFIKMQNKDFKLYYFSCNIEENEKILEFKKELQKEITLIENCFKKEELEKKNVPNFIPKKDTINLFKNLSFRYLSIFCISFLLFLIYPLYLWFLGMTLEDKNQKIRQNLEELNLQLKLKNEKKSKEEKELLRAKEELQNLEKIYLQNKNYLSLINPQKKYFLPIFAEINTLLLQNNLKIVYLFYEDGQFYLLLFGGDFYSLFPQIEKYVKVLSFSDLNPYYSLQLEAK
ncbi:hypothetical protein B6S12_04825 [Helicobacter valdiviensis]|uniref:Uncharacterized protein n=1 Tax=Helicobacter valdiviensis TaxID=1458358 RepID=A0A2W6MUQ3_9HELI|nr:hypothetical protein [Helicobacter valdiviensis]PZT48255.1 hypothetical protein B6S12_04825 [Helicobacter valdiviensis]